MTNSAVQVRGLQVRRGGRTVLDGLDLDIPSGLVTGLLGPSGAGKSTLMRAIVGVQKVAGGTVTVLGEPAGSASLRRKVGYVTQAPSIYDDLTIIDNLRYFGSLQGAPRTRADEVLDQVDLVDHRNQLAGRLSGGQRSRVSLACALVGSPDLLVLDEPTVGLDPVLRVSLWDLFNRLADDGTTLLVSSHVMDEASRCDQLVLIRQGEVLAQESLPDLLERTGAADAEGAFLALIGDADPDAPARRAGATDSTATTSAPRHAAPRTEEADR